MSPQTPALNAADLSSTTIDPAEEARRRDAAESFEAAFIQQMLQYSGLADAFTGSVGGAGLPDAMSSILLESISKDMAAQGGFGLAEQFYKEIGDLADAGADAAAIARSL